MKAYDPFLKKRKMMIRTIYSFILLSLVFLLQSCKKEILVIDDVVNKYNDVDFSRLKNISIYYRSRGSQTNTSVYFVNLFRGDCSPYVVVYNNVDMSVVEIKNHLVLASCKEDYLNKEDIESIVKQYVGYGICLLQVDEEGNVYINPNRQDGPILLRKSSESTPQDLEKFKHYKGEWYIKR